MGEKNLLLIKLNKYHKNLFSHIIKKSDWLTDHTFGRTATTQSFTLYAQVHRKVTVIFSFIQEKQKTKNLIMKIIDIIKSLSNLHYSVVEQSVSEISWWNR